MFTGCVFAAVATVADRNFRNDIILVGMLIVAMTAIIVLMATVVVIVVARADIFDDCGVYVLTVIMRLTRASMMKTAPEKRVQQHRSNSNEFVRDVH